MMDVEAQPPVVPSALPRPGKKDFCVLFDAASALIKSVEVITHVLQEATFSFTASDDASEKVLLKCDETDITASCCLKLRLWARGRVDHKNMFRVHTKTLLQLLKAIPPGNNIILERFRENPNLILKSCGIENHCYHINTLYSTVQPVMVNDLKSRFNIEFDIASFKRLLKLTESTIKSDRLRFRVVNNAKPTTKGSASAADTIAIFLDAKGDDAHGMWTFDSTLAFHEVESSSSSSSNNYQICMSNLNSEHDAPLPENVQYCSSFAVDFLSRFLKGADRHNVVIGLAEDYPMTLEYQLGIENSSIRMILAELVEDD